MHVTKFQYCYRYLFLSLILLSSLLPAAKGYSPVMMNSSYSVDTLEKVSLMFEVSHGQLNSFDIKNNPQVKKHPEKFHYSTKSILPDGFLFSNEGLLSWSPTTTQFNNLKAQVIMVDFYATSASDDHIIGQIRIIGTGEVISAAESVNSDTVNADLSTLAVEDEQLEYTPTFEPISLLLPTTEHWDTKNEGEPFDFELEASGGSGNYKFELLEPEILMGNLDQYGNFKWSPDFDNTSREEYSKSTLLKIKVFDTDGNEDVKTLPIYVNHVNRPPVVNELPTFYIRYDSPNTYHLNKEGLAYDPDGDSIIFKPVLKELPQGMTLNKKGELFWKPSKRQFSFLQEKPLYLSFTVEDYPDGVKTIGQIMIAVSQADLPPEITMIPDKEIFEIKENEELQLNFFVNDPNGENDLLSFGFTSKNREILDEALTQKENEQYEFSWIPGYDFIKEEGKKEEFTINFFAIDKESNRTEKIIHVTVEDLENLVEKDRVLYDQYRTVLERSWDMIVQLNEKENQFEKEYKVAKKGKKNRSILTAGLGGLTGLATIIDGDAQKWVAGIGGTATATLGTLEASDVIGEPPSEIMQKLNYVSQKKNDLIVYGNVFASKYALPLSRREGSYQSDLRSLSIHLNLKDIAKLELDSTWENSKNPTDKNIKREFKDFNPDPRFANDYKK